MRHEIPSVRHLPNAIEQAADGDTLVCCTADATELGKRAHARMCPDKTILWETQS